ncbi:UvrD-helicase domain-containing protein [Bacillus sp. H-16]|uniref:UvrD-helicase domain-containing protein n=1 Tax=Alteribacter salitolerans TaxID=2912333 RepID=UPI00196318E6|nr:UvrD-helicase domain-containing protein [Alteribacter salitolerans]MBM7094526.1 UvrD-helicase domain-containing protein [Alteribacter salitolerans]
MTDLIDHHQRELINNDLDRNFLVEAGAGSGKTRSLVTRMTNLILSGKYSIHEIVAITFTRKAADELKERFQASLEKTAKMTLQSGEKERVIRALESFDQCFLGTVHSFCSKLLRERPVEAGLDFDFKELDDQEDELLLEQSWERHLISTRLYNPEKLSQFHDAGMNVAELRLALKTVKEYEDVSWYTKPKEKPELDVVYRELLGLVEYAKRSLPDEKPVKGYDNLQKKMKDAINQLSYFNLNEDRNKIALIKLFNSKPSVTQNRWPSKDEAKDIEEKAKAFHEVVVRFLEEWAEYCHQLIIPFIRPALTAYKELKGELSQLNFQDMLLLTAKLLREQPEVRQYFKDKYRCLLVDEFQDTDPVQAEMMLLLTGEQNEERDWTKQTPQPGSLFVVGDPKQSIYRFRRADIDIYQKVKQMIAKTGGETLDLVMNFRTTSRITSRINPVFEAALPEYEDSYQAAYRPLISFKQDESDEEMKGVYSLTVPDGKKDEVMEAEARRIAAYIVEKVKTGKAKPSDFMILTRYNEGVSEYTKVLQEFNLPVMTSGEYGLCGDHLLTSFAHLLLYLAKPSSSFYFTAVLRGPFFGISDELLFKFKEAGGELHAFSGIPESLAGSEQRTLVYAFEKLRTYLKWSKDKLPSATIGMVADDLLLLSKYVMKNRSKRDVVHFFQMINQVREKESQGNALFGDLAAYFYELVSEAAHEEILLPEDHQAVRVMNVHKSKGLEAPYVFLAHPKKWTDVGKFIDKHIHRSETGSTGYFTFSRSVGAFNHKELIAQPAGWAEKKEEEMKYLKAEEDRLLYVAATRAEEMLIVSRTDKDKNKANPWQTLHIGITGLEEIELPASFEPPESESKQEQVVSFREYQSLRREREDWITNAGRSSYTYVTPSEKDSDTVFLERETGGGKEWGSFVHALFEQQIKDGNEARSKIPYLLGIFELDMSREEEAETLLNDFQSSSVYKRIQEASEVYTEVPFTYQEHGEAGLVIHNGIIDLIFKEDNEWVIVDYKTDHLKNPGELPALRSVYQKQLDAYINSWTKVTNEPVKEAMLHFVRYPDQ